jgi:hypothetical protein
LWAGLKPALPILAHRKSCPSRAKNSKRNRKSLAKAPRREGSEKWYFDPFGELRIDSRRNLSQIPVLSECEGTGAAQRAQKKKKESEISRKGAKTPSRKEKFFRRVFRFDSFNFAPLPDKYPRLCSGISS